jgi:hypothetical protein
MHTRHLIQHSSTALLALAFTAVIACDVESPDDVDMVEHEALLEDEAAEPDDSTPAALVSHGEPVGFDVERGMYLYDADGDSFPDVTEEGAGTDLLDPGSNPGPGEPLFPAITCRPGFSQQGDRLCISAVQGSASYMSATSTCRGLMSQVCSYEDLTYLYFNSASDGSYNPNGRWIGNMPHDQEVFCGNRSVTFNNDPDTLDFEGHCNKYDSRTFWCCHDDDS